MVDSYQDLSGRTGGGYYLIVFIIFSLVVLLFVISCPLSLFWVTRTFRVSALLYTSSSD